MLLHTAGPEYSHPPKRSPALRSGQRPPTGHQRHIELAPNRSFPNINLTPTGYAGAAGIPCPTRKAMRRWSYVRHARFAVATAPQNRPTFVTLRQEESALGGTSLSFGATSRLAPHYSSKEIEEKGSRRQGPSTGFAAAAPGLSRPRMGRRGRRRSALLRKNRRLRLPVLGLAPFNFPSALFESPFNF